MNETKHYSILYEWADWIDAQDVMQKLHISVRTLQTWRTNGLLPYSRISGKIYYRKSDILTILQKNYTGQRESLLTDHDE
jgi:predicted site-specific integrase-resolvase